MAIAVNAPVLSYENVIIAEGAMENGAAKALAQYNKALAVAKAEAGKKGKMPKPKEDIGAMLTKSAALCKTVEEQRMQLLASIKSYQDLLSGVEAACDDFNTRLSKDEFGLSKGDAEGEKSINRIRYNLGKVLEEIGIGSKSPRKEAAKVRAAIEASEMGSF